MFKIADSEFSVELYSDCGGFANIPNMHNKIDLTAFPRRIIQKNQWAIGLNGNKFYPWTLTGKQVLFGDHGRFGRSPIGPPIEEKSYNKQSSSNPNNPISNIRIFGHSLRSRIHALLGFKVVYIVLAGYGFVALAGLGFGLAFDNFITDRRRRIVGWGVALICLPLFALCFFLGLP